MTTIAILGVAVLVSGAAAVTDTRTGHIPNWLTLPVLAAAPLVHFVLGGTSSLVASLIGLAVCALLPVFLFYKGALGGGDVKLFAALGALLGAYYGMYVQFAAFLAGAVLALGELAWRGGAGKVLARSFYLIANPFLPKRMRRTIEQDALVQFRFGASIAVGAALVALHYLWVTEWSTAA